LQDDGLLKNKRKQVANCVRNTLYTGGLAATFRKDIAPASNVFSKETRHTYLRIYGWVSEVVQREGGKTGRAKCM
jgi:hypothetical protein